ncbi:hypothetical protein GDO86_012368 [Hymenochirus boettgeri]|uniref:Uncharacterized protein n=1 Tax=Hymenochirus boettgeri TaxID=247094 RepID=A0A8T2IPT0_9PIPI|nr:hypothetical protein GDO86_012368 [Hymenochirus boettgeri]
MVRLAHGMEASYKQEESSEEQCISKSGGSLRANIDLERSTRGSGADATHIDTQQYIRTRDPTWSLAADIFMSMTEMDRFLITTPQSLNRVLLCMTLLASRCCQAPQIQ